jgi:hydroxyacylglutathione hydrolase
MILEVFPSGPVDTNGYLVADRRGGHALVIDAPLDAAEPMVEQARKWNVAITHLVNTHPHWDHILDNARLLRLTRLQRCQPASLREALLAGDSCGLAHARFGLHRDAVPMLSLPQTEWFGLDLEMPKCAPDFFLEEGQPLVVGDLRFEILHCPGHCPGSVALFEPNERVVFTGDVLFAGSIGRTDLPGGDCATLLHSIIGKLLPLGDDVRVFPGHGPVTTIGAERHHNPFLNT